MKNIIIFTIAITSFGCKNGNFCKNAICTKKLVIVMVQLSDTSNIDLNGISTQTILSGKTIHTQLDKDHFPNNSFTIADDSDLEEIGFNNSKAVDLRIIKNGNVIKTVPYTIKTDCCHITKAEGPREVSLN